MAGDRSRNDVRSAGHRRTPLGDGGAGSMKPPVDTSWVTTTQRSQFGRTLHRRDKDPMRTPFWFKVLLTIAFLCSLVILGLMVWAVIEIVPPVVHWLERH